MQITSVSQILDVSTASTQVPGQWLLNALSRSSCTFDDKEICQSRDSITFGVDLVAHGRASKNLGNKLTEEALLILENNSGNLLSPEKIKLSDFEREYGNTTIEVLHILENIPAIRSDNAVKILYDLYKREDLKEWPSKRMDTHRNILFAMATQLKNSILRPPSLENELKREIKNPQYSMAAHSALFYINPQVGIDCLPDVLKVQPKGFLFLALFIAVRLRENRELIPQMESVMKDNKQFIDKVSSLLNNH